MALTGKVALVTGAAQGLGRAFSEILLNNGAKVCLLDINVSKGNDVKAFFDKTYGSESTTFIPCDVSSETWLKDAFNKVKETYGRLDIMCNNAGIINESDWEKTVALNLNAVIRGTYLALDHMKNQTGGGVIVNVASEAGLVPFISAPVYTATKYGVVGFSQATAMASEACKFGVRINVLSPIFVQTDILNDLKEPRLLGILPELIPITEKLIEHIGIIKPSDVAKAFLQLVTDESKNGEVLKIEKEGAARYVDFPYRDMVTKLGLK
uniref:15-hydroxyprostaglandin dehydrogenase [NAD(+)] n=1 Tax=Erpetoichthys calabaricus TaxID=27687 RepID=A0A8C4SBS6_ERPCA